MKKRTGCKKRTKGAARRLVLTILIFLLFMRGSPLCLAGGERNAAVENAVNGVVRIVEAERDGDTYVGSAFGVGKAGEPTDIFVTNWHVVTENSSDVPADEVGEAGEIFIVLEDEKFIRCEVLYRSHYPDIAVIKAERPVENRIALPLLESTKVSRGSTVYTIGYPGSADNFSSEHFLASVESSTITTGTVSKFGQMATANDTWVIQHDANISGGNSGGPLIAANGAVIGINTYSSTDVVTLVDSAGEMLRVDTGTYVSEYNFSVFIQYAMDALDQLGIPYDVYQDWSALILPGTLAAVMVIAIAMFVIYAKRHPVRARQPEPGMLRLQCISGTFAPRRFSIRNPTRIGRDPARNDLVYPGNVSKISGAHCQLLFEDGKLYLEDLNSKNGTYRDGVKLPVMQKVPLEVGSTFSLGDSSESFRVEVSAKR